MDDDAKRAQNARELEQLKDEITTLAGHLNAASYRLLKLIAELDRRNGWVDNETQSCAHWLNWKCGISMGAAREKVRVARALEDLPKVSAAMERGELSYWKVREITRVACAGTEDYLLMIARHGTADHLEKMVRGFRRAKDAEEMPREAIQHAERSVTWQYDADGSLLIKAKLPAEVGALVIKALEVAMTEIPVEQVQNPVVTFRPERRVLNQYRARVVLMRLQSSPNPFSGTVPKQRTVAIKTKSSCTSPQNACAITQPAAANSKTDRRCLPKPRAACRVTRASSR